MKVMSKIAAGASLALMLAGSLAVSGTAHASAEGKKNTAIALGAVAVQQLLNGNTTTGLLAGAGAAAAYQSYKDEKDDERYGFRSDRYRRDRYDRDRYSRNRYNGDHTAIDVRINSGYGRDRYGYVDVGSDRYSSRGYGSYGYDSGRYNRYGSDSHAYGHYEYDRATPRHRDSDRDRHHDRSSRRDDDRYDRHDDHRSGDREGRW